MQYIIILANSNESSILPLIPQTESKLIVDCAFVYNSENAAFDISSFA